VLVSNAPTRCLKKSIDGGKNVMKVIGKTKHGYICEVDHSELEKYMNLYYGNMGKLETGEELDLGKGYEFKNDIVSAMNKTEDLVKSHSKVLEAMARGINFLGRVKDEEEADNV
jgi:hypothetical protein